MMQVYGFYVWSYRYIARTCAANYISFKISVEGGTFKY